MLNLNDDQIRRYGMFAFIAFGVVVMLIMMISYWTFTPHTMKAPDGKIIGISSYPVFWNIFRGGFLGLLVGAGTFFTGWKMNL